MITTLYLLLTFVIFYNEPEKAFFPRLIGSAILGALATVAIVMVWAVIWSAL